MFTNKGNTERIRTCQLFQNLLNNVVHDMTWFDCPRGGEVFSVGSITFCGSLPVDHFDNDISRILDNVLKRFSR